MRAVLFADTRRVTVDSVDDPVIADDTDVIVRVTSSAICGTDLHMYDGRTGATPGLVLGHEPIGFVDQVGTAVRRLCTRPNSATNGPITAARRRRQIHRKIATPIA